MTTIKFELLSFFYWIIYYFIDSSQKQDKIRSMWIVYSFDLRYSVLLYIKCDQRYDQKPENLILFFLKCQICNFLYFFLSFFFVTISPVIFDLQERIIPQIKAKDIYSDLIFLVFCLNSIFYEIESNELSHNPDFFQVFHHISDHFWPTGAYYTSN